MKLSLLNLKVPLSLAINRLIYYIHNLPMTGSQKKQSLLLKVWSEISRVGIIWEHVRNQILGPYS